MSTPTNTQAAQPVQLFPSIVRTIVPMIVGWLLTQLAVHGLNLPEETATQIVTWVITALYYGIVRLLETRFKPAFGWLLGLPKAPTYQVPPLTEPADPPATPTPTVVGADVPLADQPPEPEQQGGEVVDPVDPNVSVYGDQTAAPLDLSGLPEPTDEVPAHDPEAGDPA